MFFFFLFVMYQSLPESMNLLSETMSHLLSSYVILGDYGKCWENTNKGSLIWKSELHLPTFSVVGVHVKNQETQFILKKCASL